MAEFENSESPPYQLAKLAGSVAGLLMMPVKLVWTPGVSRLMPDVVEWILVLMNSYLWGWCIAKIYEKVSNHASNQS